MTTPTTAPRSLHRIFISHNKADNKLGKYLADQLRGSSTILMLFGMTLKGGDITQKQEYGLVTTGQKKLATT